MIRFLTLVVVNHLIINTHIYALSYIINAQPLLTTWQSTSRSGLNTTNSWIDKDEGRPIISFILLGIFLFCFGSIMTYQVLQIIGECKRHNNINRITVHNEESDGSSTSASVSELELLSMQSPVIGENYDTSSAGFSMNHQGLTRMVVRP